MKRTICDHCGRDVPDDERFSGRLKLGTDGTISELNTPVDFCRACGEDFVTEVRNGWLRQRENAEEIDE